MLKGGEGFQRKEIAKLLAWLKQDAAPDIINLPYSLLIALAKPIKEALQRPVCCTLQGEDLFLEGLPEPSRSEALSLIRRNVQHVDSFLAVSEYYSAFMAEYLEIPPAKIHVVPLGINLQGYEARTRDRSQPFTIGFFARIAPEKGLHVLVEAYKRLRDKEMHGARLEVAGYLAPEHKNYLLDCERRLKAYGLAHEYSYRGVLDRDQKIEFLQKLDVLSVPATYHEPKGMFLLEAMACGVPTVQPRCGAFPEIIEKTEGGLLAEPTPESIAAAILKLYRDPELAATLGRNAFSNVRQHYSVANMAQKALEIYNKVLYEVPQTRFFAAKHSK
jgi:glycosyltransferase involved in cell wall biosynthesis